MKKISLYKSSKMRKRLWKYLWWSMSIVVVGYLGISWILYGEIKTPFAQRVSINMIREDKVALNRNAAPKQSPTTRTIVDKDPDLGVIGRTYITNTISDDGTKNSNLIIEESINKVINSDGTTTEVDRSKEFALREIRNVGTPQETVAITTLDIYGNGWTNTFKTGEGEKPVLNKNNGHSFWISTLPFIDSGAWMSQDEYDYTLGNSCDRHTNADGQSKIAWMGDVGNARCILTCDENNTFVGNCLEKQAIPSNEKICDGNRVVNKSNGSQVETCDECVDGACVRKVGENCSTLNQVEPRNGSDQFVFCGPDHKWQPFAGSEAIDFSSDCPNIYKTAYLEQVVGVQDKLFEGEGVYRIDCRGGEGSNLAGDLEIRLKCDPTIPITDTTSPNTCHSSGFWTSVVVHELAHTFAATNPEAQNRFSKLIGCEEGPKRKYSFKEGNEPMMEYGKENCFEAWATSADIYSDPAKACKMKDERPDQYQYFLGDSTSPFVGKEYCES